jgi:hypothetical protein
VAFAEGSVHRESAEGELLARTTAAFAVLDRSAALPSQTEPASP